MNKQLPDKWVRKAISDALSGLTVSGNDIPCYDYRTGIGTDENAYVLMSSQTAEEIKDNKCEYKWEATILLSIVTKFPAVANVGSRLQADEISEAVRAATYDLSLDGASGFRVITQSISFPADQNLSSGPEIVYQKFLRIRLLIN